MPQEMLTTDEQSVLAKYRTQRDADALARLASEEALEKQKRLAAEAAFELMPSNWTPEHKTALAAELERLRAE